MSSPKSISKRLLSGQALGYYCCALFFFILGIITKRVPLVELDNKLGISELTTALIAFLALIGAYFFIPAVVEKAIQQRNSKDTILIKDIEELCDLLKELKKTYQEYYSKQTVISERIRGEVLQDIRYISNCIHDLNDSMRTEHPELGFDKKIKNTYNEVTYKVLTEELPVKGKLTKEHFLASTNSLNALISAVKKFRFKTYR
jgi:hypothetical protein